MNQLTIWTQYVTYCERTWSSLLRGYFPMVAKRRVKTRLVRLRKIRCAYHACMHTSHSCIHTYMHTYMHTYTFESACADAGKLVCVLKPNSMICITDSEDMVYQYQDGYCMRITGVWTGGELPSVKCGYQWYE